jgi:outer membrane protein TolC
MIRLTAIFIALASACAQETLTLERAIELALENNRLVKIARLEVRKAEDQLAAARTHRLPQLQLDIFESQLLTRFDFTFPRGAFGTFPGIGPVPAAQTSISQARRPNTFLIGQAAQPLSQLYRIGLGVRLQELAGSLQREKLEEQQQAVVNNVKKIYYGLLQTQSALDAAGETIQLYTELDRVAGESLAQQALLKSDSLEIKTRLARARYDSLALGNTAADLKEQLNLLMGRDLRTGFRVRAVPEATEYAVDLDTARARALADRPELRAARLQIRQAEYDRSIKKSEYIPDVSLSFRYLSPFSLPVVPRNIAAAGLSLSWDLFDWGRKKHELAIKDGAIEQAGARLQEAEAQVLLEVDGRHRKLEQTRALLQVSALAIETARERARVETNRFQEKAALWKDVLQAQTSLAAANDQYQQALVGFWTARADFEKAIGMR